MNLNTPIYALTVLTLSALSASGLLSCFRSNRSPFHECNDSVLNGEETDIDCGGPQCNPCLQGKNCLIDTDCKSEYCDLSTKTCLPQSSCFNEIKDGAETDIDCGGPYCDSCFLEKSCSVDTDCISTYCNVSNMTCDTPSCTDSIKNGFETDVDCGGLKCLPCEDEMSCAVHSDCMSFYCSFDKTCGPRDFIDACQLEISFPPVTDFWVYVLKNVRINGVSTQIATVNAGEEVTIEFDYKITNNRNFCANCLVQLMTGWQGQNNMARNCVTELYDPYSPKKSGTTFLYAPPIPGSYYVGFNVSFDYNCPDTYFLTEAPSNYFAAICVR